MDLEIKKKRLIYQSLHRGCKEVDYILAKFAPCINELSQEELNLYEEFISEDDWDIYAYLTDNKETPKKYSNPLILKLKALL